MGLFQAHTEYRRRRLRRFAAAMVLLAGCAGPSADRRPTPGPPGPPAPATSRPYQVGGHWYHPLPHARGFTQTGVASWYGRQFHGRKTANGETYNMYGLSAAHKTLPLGIYVRVTQLDTGKQLEVRINDRGPFVEGRIIDLSYGAAKQLGLVGPGTARVRIEALGQRTAPSVAKTPASQAPAVYQPVDYQSGNFTFQVGAFKEQANAISFRDKLQQRFQNAHIVPYLHDTLGRLYAVRIGRATSLDQAETYKQQLRQNGFPGAFTIAE